MQTVISKRRMGLGVRYNRRTLVASSHRAPPSFTVIIAASQLVSERLASDSLIERWREVIMQIGAVAFTVTGWSWVDGCVGG